MPSDVDRGGTVDTAIVGGGLAGLFAAWGAIRRGADGRTWQAPRVRVLEAAPFAGGVISTVEDRGFRIEGAASSIRGASVELLAAIEELGLGDELVKAAPAAKRRWIAKGGRLVRAPAGPLSFLFSGLMSASAKLRALREPFLKETSAPTEETLAGFVARRFGEGFVDPLFDAVVTGIFAGDATRLEAESAMPRMVEFVARRGSVVRGFLAATRENRSKGIATKGLFTLRGGMSRLTNALARSLGDSLACGCEVVSLERADDGWTLQSKDGRRIRAREVILATPSWISARLLQAWSPPLAQELAAIEAANVAVVGLGVRRDQLGVSCDGLGFLVPRSEQSALLGILFESSLFPERAPAGHVLLRCMVGGERLELPSDLNAIADLAQREAARYLAMRGAPIVRRVFLHRPGIPQYRPGHARRLERIDAILRGDERLRGLALVGWSYRGIALNDRAKESLARAK